MLAESVKRLDPLIPQERVIIVTSAELVSAIKKILPNFPRKNIIGEPEGRNTAPAVALGAAIVRARTPDAVMAVLTADHVIGDLPVFRQTLADSLELAAGQDILVTIGITPREPSTGFGYLEAGAPIDTNHQTDFFKAKRFVEKPDIGTAKRYLQAGNFYWNSGMFVWSLAALEKASRKHHPEIAEFIDKFTLTGDGPEFASTLAKFYPSMEKISIDYAIMEKSDNIVMAGARFTWDDIGSWSALAQHLPTDDSGNATSGKTAVLDAQNNLAVAEPGKLIALIGVSDLAIVQHGNAILVCPKERDQDVKKIVQQLSESPDSRQWL